MTGMNLVKHWPSMLSAVPPLRTKHLTEMVKKNKNITIIREKQVFKREEELVKQK